MWTYGVFQTRLTVFIVQATVDSCWVIRGAACTKFESPQKQKPKTVGSSSSFLFLFLFLFVLNRRKHHRHKLGVELLEESKLVERKEQETIHV